MKNIVRSLIVNVLIIVVAVIIFNGVSYGMDNDPTKDNKDLLIETGNMQVVLNVPKENYSLADKYNKPISDNIGILQDGYDFSITNTGNIPIEYYEIKMVDQEKKETTLPHKYLRFTIKKDNGKYEPIKNLGDNDSILYSGYNLDVSKSISFNLKMWIDEKELDAFEKKLYGAIEVTLYQKYDVYSYYVLYDSLDSTNVPIRTSIYNPITLTIPERDGYRFLGWEKKDKQRRYNPGDTFTENIGTTLYAAWEKISNS